MTQPPAEARHAGFAPRGSTDEIERGDRFQPLFDAAGLIPAIAQDATTGEVLMMAYMSAEALRQTLDSGEAHYYSRRRGAVWRKGETSGHVQRVVELRTDCDQDCLLLRVEQMGPGACHVGYRSCFYRRLTGPVAAPTLQTDGAAAFVPETVYGKETS